MAFLQMQVSSAALLRTVNVNVILPCDKITLPGMPVVDPRPFKTLYLLHGMFGSQSDWVNYTNIQRYAEEKDLCVVMPSGENSFYVDRKATNDNMGEFVGKELVELTRKMFPLSSRREDTFIGGLSMGGYGALRNGLKYADTFSWICGLSVANLSDGLDELNEDIPFVLGKPSFVSSLLGDLKQIPQSDNSIDWLAGHTENKPKIFLACGTSDMLLEKNQRVCACLKNNGFEVQYTEAHGAHEWEFWDTHIKKFLDTIIP